VSHQREQAPATRTGQRRRSRGQRVLQEHFDALAGLYDPPTFRHICMLGINAGWRCWEVGAGGPSVPTWLSERVGPEGHVLATDINVASLNVREELPYEVREHDIGSEPPPEAGFDLAHARLVLVHVPRRDRALAAMVEAVRPGGWVFVEDVDLALQPLAAPDVTGPAQELANKVREAVNIFSSQDRPGAYGRTLPRLLREAGLVDVEADVFFSLENHHHTLYQRHMVEIRRADLVPAGLLTDEEIDQHLADLDAGRVDITSLPIVSAWARKPV
jgi:SAM-dependent methyltransferase